MFSSSLVNLSSTWGHGGLQLCARSPRAPSSRLWNPTRCFWADSDAPLTYSRTVRPNLPCGFHRGSFWPAAYCGIKSWIQFSFFHLALCGSKEKSRQMWASCSKAHKEPQCCSPRPDPLFPMTPAPEGTIQTHPVFQNRSSLVLQPDNLLPLWLIFTSFPSPCLTPGRKEAEAKGFASWWVAVLCGAC